MLKGVRNVCWFRGGIHAKEDVVVVARSCVVKAALASTTSGRVTAIDGHQLSLGLRVWVGVLYRV